VVSYYYLVAQLPYLIYGQQPPMSSEEYKELAAHWVSKKDMSFLDQLSLKPWPVKSEDTDNEHSINISDNEDNKDDENLYAKKAEPSGSSFIDKWREWERALRLNLGKFRAPKIDRLKPAVEPPDISEELLTFIQRAVEAADSPLEAELLLDKLRWNAIEELQGSNYFSRDTVLAYLLKLLILERHASFQVETGFSEYKSLYASIMKKGAKIAGGY